MENPSAFNPFGNDSFIALNSDTRSSQDNTHLSVFSCSDGMASFSKSLFYISNRKVRLSTCKITGQYYVLCLRPQREPKTDQSTNCNYIIIHVHPAS